MEQIKPHDKVVVKVKQLHGNLSTLHDAEVISISGSQALILIDGDDTPKPKPLLELTKAQTMYGAELLRPNELPVVNAIRRQ